MPLCPIKWWSLKFFVKLHKSPPLMANIVEGQGNFWQLKSLQRLFKNTFYFILANWIFYWQIRFCKCYEFSLKKMSDIREVWKYWPLKDDFHSIFQKFCKTVNLWWVDQKIKTFSRHLFWDQPSKCCIAELTAIFVCLLLSWSRRYSMK